MTFFFEVVFRAPQPSLKPNPNPNPNPTPCEDLARKKKPEKNSKILFTWF